MTTEEFEKELRKLQETLELTEKQIQELLEWHKRYSNGATNLPSFREW